MPPSSSCHLFIKMNSYPFTDFPKYAIPYWGSERRYLFFTLPVFDNTTISDFTLFPIVYPQTYRFLSLGLYVIPLQWYTLLSADFPSSATTSGITLSGVVVFNNTA